MRTYKSGAKGESKTKRQIGKASCNKYTAITKRGVIMPEELQTYGKALLQNYFSYDGRIILIHAKKLPLTTQRTHFLKKIGFSEPITYPVQFQKNYIRKLMCANNN